MYVMCGVYVSLSIYVSMLYYRLRRESAGTFTLPFNNPIEINAPFSVCLHSLNLSSNRFTINLMSLFFSSLSTNIFAQLAQLHIHQPTNQPIHTIGISIKINQKKNNRISFAKKDLLNVYRRITFAIERV